MVQHKRPLFLDSRLRGNDQRICPPVGRALLFILSSLPMETLIKSVRIELVEMRAWRTKGFDKLSPNGGHLFSVSLINFDWAKSQKTAVIHDLRIEINGRVAQIDHLLIHRTLHVFVLETKTSHASLKITEDGEFLRWNDWKKTYEGMASPLAQNNRHIAVLKDGFCQMDLLSGLIFRLQPVFHSLVLVDPKVRVDRPKRFDTSQVIKSDALMACLDKSLGQQSLLGGLARMVDGETLEAIAREVASWHRPITFNYRAKFDVPADSPAASRTEHLTDAAPDLPPALSVSDQIADRPVAPLIEEPSVVPQPVDAAPDEPGFVCRSCGSPKLSIQHGRFGYYFKCRDCIGNTPIRISCGKDGHKERVRKDGLRFYRECQECGTSRLFFENSLQ